MLDEALFAILFDSVFGLVQWVLITRFIYGIFLPENSRLLGVNHINRLTDPLIALFGFMTHEVMIKRVKPLYVAMLLLIIRFYVLPTAFDYEITGMHELALEAVILGMINSL